MFSIWEKTSFEARADLVVIGAGITGLWTAIHYARAFPQRQVLVLERGDHPSGASVKNAGFACFGSPSEILADIASEGSDQALARVEERWRGLLELRAELGDGTIGFEATGGHELFQENDPLYTSTAAGLNELNNALRSIFGTPAYEWRDALKGDLGLAVEHVAFTALEGPLDSGRMMRALIAKARMTGVEIRFRAPVERVEDGTRQVTLHLAPGERIAAEQVVVATNGYLHELFPQEDVAPARGQVLLTAPLPACRIRGTFHMNEGYYYFRDHRGGVLLGGGRHLDKAGETTTEDAVTEHIQNDLERLLREVILPGQKFTIAHRWSGIMGFRCKGKTPLVERRSPRIIIAAGLSGMGIAIGIRVARRAADLVAQP